MQSPSRVAVPAGSTSLPLSWCPRDGAVLTATANPAPHFACKSCRGVWLMRNPANDFVSKVSRRSAAPSSLLCPTDRSRLTRFHHKGVEIDVCRLCGGVWLDAGELDKITRMNRSGSGWDAAADTMMETVSQLPELVGDFAGDAVGVVLQFIAEALSGL